ncbi:putative YbeD-like domain-containing protein [Tanacetum coccineum]
MTVCTVQNLYGKALDKNVITMKIQKENFSNSFDQKSRAVTWKVNTYPTVRGFTAIGTGGDDFVQAMVVVVESVLQHQIPQGQVKQKMSSGGKYVSVNIGPVQVVSSEQVQAVYNAMKSDERMKYFL